jgi:hypothetical protein
MHERASMVRCVQDLSCFTVTLPSMALRSYHFTVRRKCKAVPLHALKANGGMSGTTLETVNLNIWWKYVANFTLRPLYPPKKEPHFPWMRRLRGFQRRSGRFRKSKKSPDDAMNRQTIPFLCNPHVVTVPNMSPRSQKVFYFTGIWYKNMFPDRNFEENKWFEKGLWLDGKMTLTVEIQHEIVSCIGVVQDGF